MASHQTITPRFKAREYVITNYMYNRLKEIYRHYLLRIDIRSEKYNDLIKKLDLKKAILHILELYFSERVVRENDGYISIIDGVYHNLDMTKANYLKNNRLFRINDISKKSKFSLSELTYFFKCYTETGYVNRYHPSRTIYIDFKGYNVSHCNYIKNACELYERAVNSAGFILEHNNHTVVKLASSEDKTGDYQYRSSILNMASSTDQSDAINNLDKVLQDTLMTDQFKLSILGTQDEVLRLSSSYSLDSYNVLKSNLIAKTGIPSSILFGTSTSEDESPSYIMFYENINTFFKNNIQPYLFKIFALIGIEESDYSFNYLYYEDTSFKNKRLEVLSKALDILNKSQGEGEELEEIKSKIIKSINEML